MQLPRGFFTNKLLIVYACSKHHFHSVDEVTLALLSKELQNVSEWFTLGIHLGISPSELHEIDQNPTLHSINDRRREMLSAWMKLPWSNWSCVVKALVEIGGRETLADKVAYHFGKPTVLLRLYCTCQFPHWGMITLHKSSPSLKTL